MKKRIISAALAAATLSVAGVAGAQTVTVDPGASANGTTLFNSVVDALNSFDALTTGTNSSVVGDNIIEVAAFGPYDETWPNIGVGTFSGIEDGSDAFIIRGTSPANRALILLNEGPSSGSGLNLAGGVDVTFENLIFASSDSVAVPSDDFFFIVDDDTVMTMDNCVLTSIPPSATVAYNTYTQETDIPADLLDGTRAYDGSGAGGNVVDTGDNGFFVGLFGSTNTSVLNLIDTVITQQGQDIIVAYGNSFTNISGASVISAGENWGFQLGNNTELNITGTPSVPVQLINNTSIAIRSFAYGGLNLQDVDITGNGGGIFLQDDGVTSGGQTLAGLNVSNNSGWGLQVFSDAVDLGTVSDSIFWGNGAGGAEFDNSGTTAWDGGNIELLNDANTVVFDNVTLGNPQTDGVTAVDPLNIRVGRPSDSAAVALSFVDSIIAGPGKGIEAAGQGGGSSSVDDSALVTAGAYALTTTFDGTVGTSNIINDDPFFVTPLDPTAATFLDISNVLYGGAGSGGSDLSGGANYTPGASESDWMQY